MKDIQFTFGIITQSTTEASEHLKLSINSIINLNIPEYQIIIIGDGFNLKNDNFLLSLNNIKIIDFDYTIKKDWITRKKNLITQNAKYENIVYQHDYISYEQDWYEGFKVYGDDFKACMTKILNNDNTRFRDWVLFPWHHCYGENYIKKAKELWEFANIQNNESMIPYNETRFSRFQYFSGSYWVAKKQIMLEIPLDEGLVWGQGEDCVWSSQFSSKYNFSMNANSTVKLLKWKQDAFSIIRPECYEKAIKYIENS